MRSSPLLLFLITTQCCFWRAECVAEDMTDRKVIDSSLDRTAVASIVLRAGAANDQRHSVIEQEELGRSREDPKVDTGCCSCWSSLLLVMIGFFIGAVAVAIFALIVWKCRSNRSSIDWADVESGHHKVNEDWLPETREHTTWWRDARCDAVCAERLHGGRSGSCSSCSSSTSTASTACSCTRYTTSETQPSTSSSTTTSSGAIDASQSADYEDTSTSAPVREADKFEKCVRAVTEAIDDFLKKGRDATIEDAKRLRRFFGVKLNSALHSRNKHLNSQLPDQDGLIKGNWLQYVCTDFQDDTDCAVLKELYEECSDAFISEQDGNDVILLKFKTPDGATYALNNGMKKIEGREYVPSRPKATDGNGMPSSALINLNWSPVDISDELSSSVVEFLQKVMVDVVCSPFKRVIGDEDRGFCICSPSQETSGLIKYLLSRTFVDGLPSQVTEWAPSP